jgi:hypothetical protein
MKTRVFAKLACSLLLPAVPALAGVVFSDFPMSGSLDARLINPYEVSNSFTLLSGATVNGVNFGLWMPSGATITSVQWAIGTDPFGTEMGSGSAGVTATFNSAALYGYDLDLATFSFSSLNLPLGTYYLSLHGAVATDQARWDINNAPGIDVWDTANGHLSAPGGCSFGGTCAESFQLLDNSGSTPEPSSWALLASGLLAAALRGKAVRRYLYRA